MKKIVTCFSLLLLLAGCEEVFIEKNPTNDPVTNFEILWQELDKKYPFLSTKASTGILRTGYISHKSARA